MGQKQESLDELLEVGVTILIQPDPTQKNSPRFKSILRGWCKNGHLWMDRPRSGDGAFVPLVEGQSCVVRFVAKGQACAFSTQVMDWDTRNVNPAMRLLWPMDYAARNFRHFERIKINLPCRIENQASQDANAQLRDLSVAGCGIATAQQFEENSIIEIFFELPDGCIIRDLKAVVRNVAKTAAGWLVGCEFTPRQPAVESDVAYFVKSTLDRRQLDQASLLTRRRVLLIDDDDEAVKRFRDALERKGLEVISAANLVDGMYRLRMSPPAAVVISEDFKDLCGIEVCRLIKRIDDFESLPVYIYGGASRNLQKAAIDAGAAAYFPPGPTLVNDLCTEISELLAGAQQKAYRAALRVT